MLKLCIPFSLFLVLLLPAQTLVAADKPLTLPNDSGDIKKYMDNGDGRCPGCGVVTDIRQVAPKGGVSSSQVSAEAAPVDEGIGGTVKPVTIAGTGAASRAARKAASAPVPPGWLVTVRYDDGSYAAFEQGDKPAVQRGERIQVVSGRVEPR